MRSIKTMLLGITFILIAIYIPHEPAFRTAGYEIFLVGLGFLIVLIGFFRKDKKEI